MRAPESGRAWEGCVKMPPSRYILINIQCRFGADPYLSGEGAYESIIGIQSQGVQAVMKHFINK